MSRNWWRCENSASAVWHIEMPKLPPRLRAFWMWKSGPGSASSIPGGKDAAGPGMRVRHREIAREKFVENAGALCGDARAQELATRVEELAGADADAVRGLLGELRAALRG